MADGSELDDLDAAGLTRVLERVAASFAMDELAYLALTSKIELPLRDRLAWALHSRSRSWEVVAREWKRTDLAVLDSNDFHRPLLLLEAKAMYSFDGWSDVTRAKYLRYLEADIQKASLLASESTSIFVLLLVTHPEGSFGGELDEVVKYASGIRRAASASPGAFAVRDRCRESLAPALRLLGPTSTGVIEAGRAFGVSVSIDYWIIGPCDHPDRPPTLV